MLLKAGLLFKDHRKLLESKLTFVFEVKFEITSKASWAVSRKSMTDWLCIVKISKTLDWENVPQMMCSGLLCEWLSFTCVTTEFWVCDIDIGLAGERENVWVWLFACTYNVFEWWLCFFFYALNSILTPQNMHLVHWILSE